LIKEVGASEHGQYELAAVLTHVGRSADAGHYMAWTRKDEDNWYKFDGIY
jgi:ubiquitin carboxyl-terminal hydrolase 14